MNSEGRIFLSQEVRERLGIDAGTEVEVRERDGKAVVEPKDDPGQIVEGMERLVAEAAADRNDPVEDAHPLAKDHAETIRRRTADESTDE